MPPPYGNLEPKQKSERKIILPMVFSKTPPAPPHSVILVTIVTARQATLYISHFHSHSHSPARLQPGHHQQSLDSLPHLLLTRCIHHRTQHDYCSQQQAVSLGTKHCLLHLDEQSLCMSKQTTSLVPSGHCVFGFLAFRASGRSTSLSRYF